MVTQKGTDMSDSNTPIGDATEAALQTEAEQNAQTDVGRVNPTPEPALTLGVASPPSDTLDTEDGGSDWDKDSFVAPTEETMPTEGPGSPGYDVYAPENARWENSGELAASDESPDERTDTEVEADNNADVEKALQSETADGQGNPDDEKDSA